MFPFRPQRFAARRDNMRLWCLADDAFGQGCRDVNDMLATVEYKQYLLVTSEGQ
jgi:hypothetical protein